MNSWSLFGWEYSRDNGLLTIKPPGNEVVYLRGKIIEMMKYAAREEDPEETFRLSRMAYELGVKKEISNISYEDRHALVRIEHLPNFSIIINRFLDLTKEPVDYPILADQTAKDLQLVVDG